MQEFQDEAIIQMILQGNKKAYAILIERYRHFVFTLVKRMASNHEDAEEITQDVFVKAFHSLAGYGGTSKFSTWLYSIARNTALSHIRKQKLVPTSDDELKISDISTVQALDKKNKKALIHSAINQLEPSEAQVLTLFYLHEQTIDEIAMVLDITKSNVKVKLYRSRKKLKELLDKNYSNEFTEYQNSNN